MWASPFILMKIANKGSIWQLGIFKGDIVSKKEKEKEKEKKKV